MALQTNYSETMAAFVEGMIPDMRTPGQDVSRNVETAAGIGFGKVAVQGTADKQIVVSEASKTFIGITVLDTTQLQEKYLQYGSARVRTKGPVVVTAGAAVVAGASAYFVPATGVFNSTPTGNTLIGTFETSGADGDLVVLNLT